MRYLYLIISLYIITIAAKAYPQALNHNLYVELNIPDQSIKVVDSMVFPLIEPAEMFFYEFSLNKNLFPKIDGRNAKITEVALNDNNNSYKRYKIEITNERPEDAVIVIKYSGRIHKKVSAGANDYARGFSKTSGIISEAGIYLAGSSYWIPTFENSPLTFEMTVALDSSWNVVSQGERVMNKVKGDRRIIQYLSEQPMNEIYLLSAPWTEYTQMSGEVLLQAFLRTPDPALAKRYLDATSDYLDMYVELIGPYPYSKFALVENFWETGYGMPSFTLLGEKIIRFPWILSTSYPHELLHNWWGNSVYVDYGKGNWCEGLTAYMADHLLKEQTGKGAEYRLSTLQGFTDYVNKENDFPVIKFRSRNNPAQEAIGYGKCLMFNHMLRNRVGDDVFISAYRSFYRDNIYQYASFDDILQSFNEHTEIELNSFFDQWLTRKGAPSLELSNVQVEAISNGFDLHFNISQVQDEDPFVLNVPVAIYLEEEVEIIDVISDQETNSFSFSFKSKPVKIVVDPHFDIFRRLDKSEVPPTLSQIFGSDETLIILPQSSPILEDYKSLAEVWKLTQEAQGKSLRIVMDADVEDIPKNASAWIVGFENKYASLFNVQKNYPQSFNQEQKEMLHKLSVNGSLVYATPNPVNNNYTLGFLGTNVRAAVPGLTRLLTHYGKYSFLGFEGDRPNNVMKGRFPAINSSLYHAIPYGGKFLESNAVLEVQKPLIE